MVRHTAIWILFMLMTLASSATIVHGVIRTSSGKILPFASVIVKGTTQGVAANANGLYTLQLSPGSYTLLAQYIGHVSVEKQIRVGRDELEVNFVLAEQQYTLSAVEVASGGEDPAYAIIRKTIAAREQHLKEIRSFQCEVYIKGRMQLRSYPKFLLGRKIDFEDGDTSKQKMIFLSETLARYSVKQPDKEKVEVLSTKVSGRSGAFGLSDPQIISFYENNISVGDNLNPRGFVSPIANGAMNYYRYHFEGTFFENGREISKIRVIPKRSYEPVFSGYINIIEDEWRLQSVDLLLVKTQQLQFLDTLRIQQLYVPSGKFWIIKNQVIYPSGKFIGFDFFGSFVQVYDKFSMNPALPFRFFDHTVLKFFDSSNKKSPAYWDSIRPLPLLAEEKLDYKKKDSLEEIRKDPRYLDSLDAKRNKIRVASLLFTGQSFVKRKKKEMISFSSLLSTFNYNTVEGGVIDFSPRYGKQFEGRHSLFINPDIRYGLADHHLNPSVSMGMVFGKKYYQSLSVAGGRKVLEYNNTGSITERLNTLTTLLSEANYRKIYEANFFALGYGAGMGNGLTLSAGFEFQDRFALDNLAHPISWKDIANRSFTPNYPGELISQPMERNRAARFTMGLSWHPGADYIEFPDRKMSIGSKYPTFTLSITKGLPGFLGSDVDYLKWRVGIADDVDLKLRGALKYHILAGGFLTANRTYVPDLQHYLGNQTIFASRELNSFQLAPYYIYSNTSRFSLEAHAEYHLNGWITNKVPVLKRLNWFLVTGVNALHIQNDRDYYEWLIGIENILKVIRVDFVQGFAAGGNRPSGFRLSLPLF